MQVRNVIAAVEVVVDEHLPVAVERIASAAPSSAGRRARCGAAAQVGAEKLIERGPPASSLTNTHFSQPRNRAARGRSPSDRSRRRR